MRRNLIKSLVIVFCISFFHLFWVYPAPSQETGLTAGGFQWGGSVELGYRFTDIDGSKDRYKETVNFQDGLKLFDFSLWGKRLQEDPKSLVDSLRFNVSNIGDPYASGRLELKKNNTYALNINYKQYKYFTERDEHNFYFTDNTNFDTTIRTGSILLSVFPQDDVKLNFGYNHAQRDGDAYVPRFQFFFPMEGDLKEQFNEYFISADFPIANWDMHVKQSLWTFSNKNTVSAAYVDPFSEKQDTNTTTLVTTIKGHTRLSERADFDGAVIYAHSDGKAELTTLPITTVFPGTGRLDSDTLIVEAGLSYLIQKGLVFHADYRFHTLDQDGHSNTDPFIGAPGEFNTDYSLMAHTGTFQLEYIPMDNLTVRGGYRVQYQRTEGDNYVDNVFNGGKHPSNNTNWLNGWVASADWKPYKVLSIFGEYEGASFSNPYTWISPENQNVARIKIKYDTPIDKLSLKGTFLWKRRVNPDQNYRTDVRDYIVTAIYQPTPRLSIDGSYTYENVQDGKNNFNPVQYAFERAAFNSSASIWSGGITFENIYQGLGGRIYGSYAKSLGENPQNYADGLISLWYKNKCVTPILTFERTYLTDKVNHWDGFNANLLTFSLRKDF